ncbi:MAG: hypothetical protein AB7P33_02205 [Dehalococcoidia bacterium]
MNLLGLLLADAIGNLLSRKWFQPFGWIILIPIVTGLTTAFLQDQFWPSCEYVNDHYQCPSTDVALSLTPGLLNLVAFAWRLSSEPRVRAAALIAGLLGTARFVLPIAGVLLSGDSIRFDYTGWGYSTATSSLSMILWLSSCAAALVFGLVTMPQEGGPRLKSEALLSKPVSEALEHTEAKEDEGAAPSGLPRA